MDKFPITTKNSEIILEDNTTIEINDTFYIEDAESDHTILTIKNEESTIEIVLSPLERKMLANSLSGSY
ncbi:hypothetical protein [Metabacillus bambusae]|uniref:Uncharacterized protein n=1 Tax=Metabacillus bambusae TaxID=2795218 RepID=A0ABS3NBM2_9BACI|nr:hypothetical protein [Metabacillus bambusae]MBO1515684.1 hypothetical protein [Metabacillus bambusae]